MAFCPPPANIDARVPWVQDPNSAASFLRTDALGNLCVKVDGATPIGGTTSSCKTNFVLGTLPNADTEVQLTSLLGGLTDILEIEIYNTKDAAKYEDLRIATDSGLVATSAEPHLNLQWGCAYNLTCNSIDDLYLASSMAGHIFLIEVITLV